MKVAKELRIRKAIKAILNENSQVTIRKADVK